MSKRVENLSEHFWQYVDIQEDDCWLWTISVTSAGYGQIVMQQRHYLSHRFAYEDTYGEIPEDLFVDHTCHNDTDCTGGKECLHRKCCNPRHLEPVTNLENVNRSHNSESKKTHCPQGHEYNEENTGHSTRSRRGFTSVERYCRACARDRARVHKLSLV